MLDLAASTRAGELGAAIDQALTLGVYDKRAVDDVIARNAGHRGVGRLRRAVEGLTVSAVVLRSEFERRFRPIAQATGLGEPLVNHTITLPDGAVEVDFYFPSVSLVVELDGYEFHKGPAEFKRDRRRDRRLAAVGIEVMRFVWEDLDDPGGIRRELNEVVRFRA